MQKEITPAYRIYPLGDQALCIDWGNRIDPALNGRVLALFEAFRQLHLPGILNIVPAYSSLCVVFDAPALIRHFPGQAPHEALCRELERVLQRLDSGTEKIGRLLEIPVCYGTDFGPDLHRLALGAGLSADEVIRLHTGQEYRVYLLGFLPGFAYMGRVDPQIAAPRLPTPRTQVPAGSVGIAGEQTGIYPQASPGGWNLIGRTPLQLFDAGNPDPTLLHPGDRVRFFPISPEQFHQLSTAL